MKLHMPDVYKLLCTTGCTNDQYLEDVEDMIATHIMKDDLYFNLGEVKAIGDFAEFLASQDMA